MSTLETDRVLLRRLTPDDAPALFRTVGDRAVMRYWAPGPDRDIDQTRARINEIDDHWLVHGFGDWAVVSKPEGGVVGFSGLHRIADMDEVNIGYALERRLWRQGLGYEVCGLVLDHGFRRLGLSEVVAVIDPRNKASIKFIEKCGFTFRQRFHWSGRKRNCYAVTSEQWGRSCST